MKTIATIILVCFGIFFSQGQSALKLSIKKSSDTPNYESEHFYLLEIFNNGTTVSNVNLSINNKDCENIKRADHIELIQDLLDKSKQNKLQQIVVQPGKSVEFYVKLSRPNNARLDTWNCTEIIATSVDGRALSNAITIKSLIPNPKNYN